MNATRLTFGFSRTEDRLVLWAGDGRAETVALALPRRLIGQLINTLASLLERSSAIAGFVPADLRDGIILMEHQGAVLGAGQGHQGAGAAPSVQAPTTPPRLVKKIEITTTPANFQMVFAPVDGTPVAVRLSRAELHRVVEVIHRKAQIADWNLQIDAGWLDMNRADASTHRASSVLQ